VNLAKTVGSRKEPVAYTPPALVRLLPGMFSSHLLERSFRGPEALRPAPTMEKTWSISDFFKAVHFCRDRRRNGYIDSDSTVAHSDATLRNEVHGVTCSERVSRRVIHAAIALVGGVHPGPLFWSSALRLQALSSSQPGLVRPTKYTHFAAAAPFSAAQASQPGTRLHLARGNGG